VVKLVDNVIPREKFAQAHQWWLFDNTRTLFMASLKQAHLGKPTGAFKTLGEMCVRGLDEYNE
jgi:hypothetical protein